MKPKTAGCDGGEGRSAGPFVFATLPASPAAARAQAGFVHDARLITMQGSRAVQDIVRGDRIISRNQGAVIVRRVEQISCVVRAIYVIAGSLGHNRPDRDSLLTADQCVLVRDWRARAFGYHHGVLLRASDLVDGEFVRDLGYLPMTLYRIICDSPQVIYADGLELGTADAQADLCLPQLH